MYTYVCIHTHTHRYIYIYICQFNIPKLPHPKISFQGSTTVALTVTSLGSSCSLRRAAKRCWACGQRRLLPQA